MTTHLCMGAHFFSLLSSAYIVPLDRFVACAYTMSVLQQDLQVANCQIYFQPKRWFLKKTFFQLTSDFIREIFVFFTRRKARIKMAFFTKISLSLFSNKSTNLILVVSKKLGYPRKLEWVHKLRGKVDLPIPPSFREENEKSPSVTKLRVDFTAANYLAPRVVWSQLTLIFGRERNYKVFFAIFLTTKYKVPE